MDPVTGFIRVSVGVDRNLPQPTTVYGHQFITSGSYRFQTGFLLDTASFLPNTARFLAVFMGNAWEYCCQETLTWADNILGILFQLPDKRAISRALESVRVALMTEFIPYNLCFNHVDHNEIINRRTSEIAR